VGMKTTGAFECLIAAGRWGARACTGPEPGQAGQGDKTAVR
jgi:hypothetical protein